MSGWSELSGRRPLLHPRFLTCRVQECRPGQRDRDDAQMLPSARVRGGRIGGAQQMLLPAAPPVPSRVPGLCQFSLPVVYLLLTPLLCFVTAVS